MIPEHQKVYIETRPKERAEAIGQLIDWLLEQHIFAGFDEEMCILISKHHAKKFSLELTNEEALRLGLYVKKIQALA